MLDKIRVPAESGEEEILRRVERYGIALLPGFVPSTKLEALKAEVLDLLDREQKSGKGFLSKGRSRVARLQDGLDPALYPVGAGALSDGLLSRIARGYYAPHAFTLNRQVYVTHDQDVMNYSSQWHLDPSRSLKFFIYVTDTSKENGAFMYAPGSHREGFFRIMYYRSRGLDAFPQAIPEDELPTKALSVESGAGSLLVFEAAGFHRAGELRPGLERLVIRGHSYPKTTRLGRFLGRLLRRSPLNLARYGLVEDDRVNERFKTRATPYVD